MTDQPEENEIMAAAREAKARAKGAAANAPEPAKLSKWGIAAIGAGIGSAAVAAALIYANRNKKR